MTKHLQYKRNQNNNRYKNKNTLHKSIHHNITNNAVVNLSDTQIPQPTINLLYKGLKFIPSPKPTNYNTIYKSFLKYRRNMYIKHYFRNYTNNKHPFKLPSNFDPPPPDNSSLMEYISHVYHDLKTQHTTNINAKHNLSSNEFRSIQQLKQTNELIIKPADKAGALVIWPKEDYLAEAYKQLHNTNHYIPIPNNPTQQIQHNIRTLANKMFNDKLIDYITHKFLLPSTTARTPTLYLLPKIHKPNIPGRPIISGCEGPTVSLSQYADYILKPLLTDIPSYTKDTTDFLQRVFSLNDHLPENPILVTIDVKSLYTNIPNDEGIEACIEMLNCDPHDNTLNTQTIRDILSLVLNNNFFTFNNGYFLQIHGTAMGSPMAPTYANIFMAVLEKHMLRNAPNGLTPFEWIRHIDDIVAIWTHGIDALNEFVEYINSFHNTIKFDYKLSTKSVDFLDTTIYINRDNKLESDIYIKPRQNTTTTQ